MRTVPKSSEVLWSFSGVGSRGVLGGSKFLELLGILTCVLISNFLGVVFAVSKKF